jgi:formiminotetrahydrofolate cyclodeaminase
MDELQGFKDLRVEDLLQKLAREVPTLPAAGTALALLGAMASALEEFVAGLSSRRDLDEHQTRELEKIRADLTRLRRKCIALMDHDAHAYGKVIEAMRMPRTTVEEQMRRDAALLRAFAGALDPPMVLSEHALRMLETGHRLIRWGYPAALSDAAAAVEMAYACLQGSIWIARANLQQLAGSRAAQKYRRRFAELQSKAEELYSAVRRELADRL